MQIGSLYNFYFEVRFKIILGEVHFPAKVSLMSKILKYFIIAKKEFIQFIISIFIISWAFYYQINNYINYKCDVI